MSIDFFHYIKCRDEFVLILLKYIIIVCNVIESCEMQANIVISLFVLLFVIYAGATLSQDIYQTTELTTTEIIDFNNPYFDGGIPLNVTAVVGKSAFLRCKGRNLGNKTLAWIRHRDIHILTVGSYTYTTDQRFHVTYNKEKGESILEIKWVNFRDSGLFECQICSEPIRSLFINLDVVVPTAVIWGGPEISVERGHMINITCSINYSNEPPAYIFWYHQDEVINFDSARGGVSVITEKADVTISHLLIQKADLADSGKYSCSPSNADVAIVRVYVL